MTTKAKVIISIIVVVTSFAVGRYTTPTIVKVETKIVEVESKTKVTDENQERTKNKKKVTKTVTKPDGTKIETSKETETSETTKTNKTNEADNKTTTKNESKETVKQSGFTSISLLGGMSLNAPAQPIWGLSVQRSIFGPVTIGLFGLSNSCVGASVGVYW